MRISKALIVADPWIGFILDGSKTWEMRSSATSFRGWFGLIRKGTGAVHGVARLIDVGSPLSPSGMIETINRHRIPEHMIRSGEVAKWNTPWKLADVRRLHSPVPYRHRSGAVTWVDLDTDVVDAIARRLGEPAAIASVPNAAVHNGQTVASADPAPRRPRQVAEGAGRPQRASTPSTGQLIGQVDLTQGNIDNNHIYLRGFFDRFPEDAVGGSNRREKAAREISVDWGGGAPVSTDLDGTKRFFRARGWVGNFFELNDARAGDTVYVEETGPYRYRVSLRKPAGSQ